MYKKVSNKKLKSKRFIPYTVIYERQSFLHHDHTFLLMIMTFYILNNKMKTLKIITKIFASLVSCRNISIIFSIDHVDTRAFTFSEIQIYFYFDSIPLN